MKLSLKYRLDQLMRERDRLRTSIAAALGDEDIKVSIQGSPAQGNVRQACLKAIAALYDGELETNTKALQAIGVEVDDGPVKPARPRGEWMEEA